MNKKDDALKLALDWYDSGNENPDDFANMIKQVIALSHAPEVREQPAYQEPVAWMSAHRFEELRQGFTVMTTLTKQKAFEDDVGIYTSPQSKPWVGLTLDDHIELAKAVAVNKHQIRAIEVKLWEKNA